MKFLCFCLGDTGFFGDLDFGIYIILKKKHGGIMDRMDTSDDFGHNSGLVPKWEVKAVQIAKNKPTRMAIEFAWENMTTNVIWQVLSKEGGYHGICSKDGIQPSLRGYKSKRSGCVQRGIYQPLE